MQQGDRGLRGVNKNQMQPYESLPRNTYFFVSGPLKSEKKIQIGLIDI